MVDTPCGFPNQHTPHYHADNTHWCPGLTTDKTTAVDLLRRARESVAMWADVVEHRSGQTAWQDRQLINEINNYLGDTE